jgi:hypothetical protein
MTPGAAGKVLAGIIFVVVTVLVYQVVLAALLPRLDRLAGWPPDVSVPYITPRGTVMPRLTGITAYKPFWLRLAPLAVTMAVAVPVTWCSMLLVRRLDGR